MQAYKMRADYFYSAEVARVDWGEVAGELEQRAGAGTNLPNADPPLAVLTTDSFQVRYHSQLGTQINKSRL